jgi:phosphoribosylformylglycinamidine synthase
MQTCFSLYKGTVTTTAKLAFSSCELDIAKYRDIWFKTSFIRSKQSKTEQLSKRLIIIKPSLTVTFPAHFTGKSQLLTENARPKAAIIREKEVTQNVKWLCI